MTFVSLKFYVFIIIILAAYYVLPIKYRWYALLGGSLGFYFIISNGSFFACSILLLLSVMAWLFGIIIPQLEFNKSSKVILMIVVLSMPLTVIKLVAMFDVNFINKNMPYWWITPVGISFFTLQLLSYCVDVYKGAISPEKNFLHFLLFTSFFPQIIQGPIPRYSQLAHQLVRGNKFDERKFVKGFMLIIWGFFLKLCIADRAGVVVDTIFGKPEVYGGIYALIGGILYSFQLYTDFLSCTTFAQGVAGLFGIEIIDNFAHPYFAKSIKDFWRRWHISLSSWLRDYIYIPLGGNRLGKYRKYFNIIIVFLVSGLWHGDGVKFLFWGLLHGFYQVTGEVLKPVREVCCRKIGWEKDNSTIIGVDTIITFSFVMIGWIIFRADSLSAGLSMVKSIITTKNFWVLTDDSLFTLGLSWKESVLLVTCLMVLLIVSYFQEKGSVIRDIILKQNILIRWGLYISAMVFIMVFGTYGWGYDSQAFIYGGF